MIYVDIPGSRDGSADAYWQELMRQNAADFGPNLPSGPNMTQVLAEVDQAQMATLPDTGHSGLGGSGILAKWEGLSFPWKVAIIVGLVAVGVGLMSGR